MYDGLLRSLDSFKDVDVVAFADDLALIITIRKMQEIGDRVRGLVEIVANWCNDAGLRLAMEKTEMILLTGKRVPKVFNLDVGGGGIDEAVLRNLGIGSVVRSADLGIYPGKGEEQEDNDQCPEGDTGKDIDSVQHSVARSTVRVNGQYVHTH